MALRLTKQELRDQQQKLGQLVHYLPTLQLKKSLLQIEVNMARIELRRLEELFTEQRQTVSQYSALLTERGGVDPRRVAVVKQLSIRWDNIAGVDIPIFEGIEFEPYELPLMVLPPWADGVIAGIRKLMELKAQLQVAQEKFQSLQAELRTVSLRVNLFEKVLIPRTQANLRKIQVFLGDQQLAAVAQAKAAKAKILRRRALIEGEAA